MSVVNSALAWILSVLLLLMQGCVDLFYPPPFRECPTLSRTYFAEHGRQEQTAAFLAYDQEMQYKIFICGMQYEHAPILELLDAYAAGGETAARFLKVKLAEAESDRTVVNILQVYDEMHRMGTYDCLADEQLMQIIESKLENMRNPGWRRFAEKILRRIQRRAESQ